MESVLVAESSRLSSWRSYLNMTKPTISLLVVFTVLPAMFMASPSLPSIAEVAVVLFATYLASSSAAVFNHLLDADIDLKMNRTKNRPLPSKAVRSDLTLCFASVLGCIAFAIMYLYVNPLAAWLSLWANAFYVLVYTLYLKRRTPQNIVIGGAAGAVGPLIGWAAAVESIGWEAWVLFGVIFTWTPPHFWALALKYKDDYKKASVPMLPNVKGNDATRFQMLAYAISLIPLVMSLYVFGDAGIFYLVSSMIATLYFVWLAWKLYKYKDMNFTTPVFIFSLFYIFIVFGSLAIEQLIIRI